jgi:type IV secretory pathway VirB2 component (pilin)
MKSTKKSCLKRLSYIGTAFMLAVLTFYTNIAFASGGGNDMPFNDSLQTVLDALTGTTAKIIVGIAFFIAGSMILFGNNQEGAKKLGGVVIGAAIIFGAQNMSELLGLSGAIF